jgi:hypothetical protein
VTELLGSVRCGLLLVDVGEGDAVLVDREHVGNVRGGGGCEPPQRARLCLEQTGMVGVVSLYEDTLPVRAGGAVAAADGTALDPLEPDRRPAGQLLDQCGRERHAAIFACSLPAAALDRWD